MEGVDLPPLPRYAATYVDPALVLLLLALSRVLLWALLLSSGYSGPCCTLSTYLQHTFLREARGSTRRTLQLRGRQPPLDKQPLVVLATAVGVS
ncbi:hypothetical protein GGR51DRAFT_14917 [Nemania sp. FL0031]|nr:hypothetical protein GGR51DRAFT_14917 [Nemania sp. FL0031]